ncbi:MAG TPA: 3-hydroxybenzoate 6-monooxygenase [Burkholderiales bacterium]|nr:3-hydroxybenzoate 6-monooxygenase [Burkholderiales bacterium]
MSDRTDQALPILIAGGGIGGICAALALARIGLRVHVLEQAAQFKEIGAGIQIAPNAFHVFHALGITEAITRAAAFPEALIVMDSVSGDEVTRIPVGPEFRARFGYPYGLIHRADLHAILVGACRRSPLVTLSASRQVREFEDRGDRVTVHLESGEALDGAALIGADGLWSTVRTTVVGDGKPRVSGHIAYRAVMPASEVPAANRRNAMIIWAGPKTHLVHYPLRRGELFNLVAVFDSNRYEEGWDSYGDLGELNERFEGTRPEVQGMLAKIDSWRMWVLCDREPIKEWSRGRTTLLGDAAHPMLQYLAQGACMAMEDAVCLAAKLEAAGGDCERAFRDYQQARYLRTARVQLTARLYGEVLHASGATRDLRNAYLSARTPEQAYESMAWLYDAREAADSWR